MIFNNVEAAIFLVDITAYDSKDETNMQESLMLFESIFGRLQPDMKHLLLFFNKIDLLEEKLRTSTINDFFPKFNGNPTNVEAKIFFFCEKFLTIAREKDVHVFYTNCVNDESVGNLAFHTLKLCLGKGSSNDSSDVDTRP